jgi:integrase/recombinase XerD
MKSLGGHLKDYLALRRRLGFKLRNTEGLLRQFIRFAKKSRTAHVTTRLVLRWATQRPQLEPATLAARYRTARLFALYLSTVHSGVEVPPPGLLPYRKDRKSPYIYSEEEIVRLMRAAARLPSSRGLRGHTLSTLVGLLAVTGMRIGEAIHLDRDEVDLPNAMLTIHHAKGHRTRLIPIHPSTCKALRRFARLRDRLCPEGKSQNFFVSERGTRLNDNRVRAWFATVSRRIGLRGPQDTRGPRLHDLRHSFTVKTLLGWYRTDNDVEAHMPELSTYLGHLHVSGTYWYVSAVPELLRQATRRLERKRGVRLS